MMNRIGDPWNKPMPPPPTTTINIYYKSLTGITRPLTVSKGATIGHVMAGICAVDGTPVDQQKLIFAGKELDPERSLDSYKIQAGSTLHLVLRLRGC
jgi:hypothetical protein